MFRRQPTEEIISNNSTITSPQTSTAAFPFASSSSVSTSSTVVTAPSLKGPITVDTSRARSNTELLRMCIAELGWQEYAATTGGAAPDVIWQSFASHENDQQPAPPTHLAARINKFPCMNLLLRKGPLIHSLNVMRSLFKKQYDFYPRTWFLPKAVLYLRRRA